jgi:hypothetical protein
MTGAVDDKLLEEFLKEEDPTRKKLDQVTTHYETAKACLKALTPETATAAAVRSNQPGSGSGNRDNRGATGGGNRDNRGATGGGNRDNRGSGNDGRSNRGTQYTPRQQFLQGLRDDNKCFRCGNKWGEDGEHKCPAMNTTCQTCGKIGHLPSVCLQRFQRTTAPPPPPYRWTTNDGNRGNETNTAATSSTVQAGQA